MGIEADRAVITRQLAPLLEVTVADVERAILLVHERSDVEERNLVSVLATAAHLAALLTAMSDEGRHACVMHVDKDDRTRRDRALAGELDRVAVEICEEAAGPTDVLWDGNWPSSRKRLRGRIPARFAPGDVIIGGDGGGTRIDILVTEDDDGALTGEHMSDAWRDPPLEDVWVETYRRLERLYAEEVPLAVRRPADPEPEI